VRLRLAGADLLQVHRRDAVQTADDRGGVVVLHAGDKQSERKGRRPALMRARLEGRFNFYIEFERQERGEQPPPAIAIS
jgi:hypothetical protein